MDANTEAAFFKGKPDELALYTHIKRYIGSLGPVETKVTKSQIAFSRGRQFAWIWFPMSWDTRRPPHSLVLSFSLGKEIRDPQVVEVVQPYPGRFMHHVIIGRDTDFSAMAKHWLADAYKFAGSKG